MTENEELLALLFKFLAKNMPGFFSICGVIAVVICLFVFRKTFFRWWRRFIGVSEPDEPPRERRANDLIISKLIDALVQGGQKIASELHDLSSSIREQTKGMNQGFADLHRKIESLAAGKGGSHGR